MLVFNCDEVPFYLDGKARRRAQHLFYRLGYRCQIHRTHLHRSVQVRYVLVALVAMALHSHLDAWGCFDEFNRLDEAVLSAVSMQIQVIQDALKSGASTLTLLERSIEINPNSGIFVTLNPAGKGYGGRSKLPDNLKQLFRPVAMSKPNNELIAEVLLYADGFKTANVLGRKLVALFNLSRELLTTQQHYDWGLRALKTVLKGCGTLLKNARSNHSTYE